jgi:hypothetical protein
MKRTKLILAVIGLSLLLAAGSEAGPLFGGSSSVVDINFVGFCDGLHMTINYNTGKVIANRTGCADPEALWGTVGALLDTSYKGGAVTLMNPAADGVTPLYVVILDNPMIWIYYKAGGVKWNSGTYALGAPALEAQGAGLGPSTAPK